MSASPDASFGPFALRDGALWRDGEPVALGQRALALLGALAGADGSVTKQQLMEAGWPGTAVEEGNLTVQIAALRKALGERADGGEWIVTVPRVGYRLARGDGTPQAPEQPRPPAVAVLPFENVGGDRSDEYFADGVVEDIITALNRFRWFAVISRNSSFVYKGRSTDIRRVAQDLGVRYVVEGSLRRAGNRLRITARLGNSITAQQLWSQTYDGSADDVFEFQDRITQSVATIVEPRIREAEIDASRRDRPESLAAYDLYLRSLPYFRAGPESDNQVAYELLCKAIALEPRNATFLAQAVNVLQHRCNMGWRALTADDRAECGRLADIALSNAPDDPTVLAKCGNAILQVGRDYDRGSAILNRAVALNPNDGEVLSCAGIAAMHVGDLADALKYFRRTLELSPGDPFAFVPLTGEAGVLITQERYAEALAIAERSLAVHGSYDPTYWMLIAANAHLGRLDEARALRVKLQELVPGVTITGIRTAQPDKYPDRMASLLEGLRLAGLPEV